MIKKLTIFSLFAITSLTAYSQENTDSLVAKEQVEVTESIGLFSGLEFGRIIGHGGNMLSIGIAPPINYNFGAYYKRLFSSENIWGEMYTLEYSNRGFQTDGDAVSTLSLQYINATARFIKPFYKDFEFDFGAYFSTLLSAKYQIGNSSIYNVKDLYRPIDFGAVLAIRYEIHSFFSLEFIQYLGLFPLDQTGAIYEFNNSSVIKGIFNLDI